MATWAVGDLQGCAEPFARLLDRIEFDPARDQLWLVGDLVNRGPDSVGVLRRVRALGESARVVLGNHDLHLLAVAAGGGRGLREGDTLGPLLAAPDREELLGWLQAQPLLHTDADLGWTMVHAGLAPQWSLAEATACAREVEAALRADARAFFAEMYGDQPDTWAPDLAGTARLRFTVNCLTRLRYCTAAGRLLPKLKGPPAAAPVGALPWFTVPGRRTGGVRTVFGHWSALGLYRGDDVLGLDTGCVWGGALSAVRLDSPGLPGDLPVWQVAAAA